jgi:CubicO group peptidase (beta-lactamase class C family)
MVNSGQYTCPVADETPAPPPALSPLLSAFFDLARKHRVPGAQLAIHHGGAITASEVGDLEFGVGRRITRDAAIPVGSITKCFTATVAMALVADGDVDLDAPVRDYVPELGDLGAMISLRQLLSHTSGLAEGSGAEETATSTVRHYIVEHVRRRALVQPPGMGFSYSNPGYIVVGRLIETVTGMSWSEAVESILLRPLGIEPAFVGLPGTAPARRPVATGHSVNTAVGRIRPVRNERGPAEAPAGALAVSAVDLVKLGLIHVGPGRPGILPTAWAAEMRRPVLGADPFGLADGWGLGLAMFRQQAADWVGHDGNANGTSCYLRINLVDGWVVALTSNSNTGIGLWQDLQPELARANCPVALPRISVPDGQQIVPPRGCAGLYVNGDIRYSVKVDGAGSAYLSFDAKNFVPITLCEDLAFTFSMPDLISIGQVFNGRFVRDPTTGKVYGIHVSGRLARRIPFPEWRHRPVSV